MRLRMRLLYLWERAFGGEVEMDCEYGSDVNLCEIPFGPIHQERNQLNTI